MHAENVNPVLIRQFSDDGFVVCYPLIEGILNGLPRGVVGTAGVISARKIVEGTIEALIERGHCSTQDTPDE